MITSIHTPKHYVMMLLLIVSALSFTACDDDDDNYYDSPNSPLCGEWYSPETGTFFEFDRDGDGEYEDIDGYEYDFTWSAGDGWISVYFYDGTVWNFNWSFAPNGCLQLYNLGTGYTTVYWRQ